MPTLVSDSSYKQEQDLHANVSLLRDLYTKSFDVLQSETDIKLKELGYGHVERTLVESLKTQFPAVVQQLSELELSLTEAHMKNTGLQENQTSCLDRINELKGILQDV